MKSEYELWKDERDRIAEGRSITWEPYVFLGVVGFAVGLAIGVAWAAQRGLI